MNPMKRKKSLKSMYAKRVDLRDLKKSLTKKCALADYGKSLYLVMVIFYLIGINFY